MTGIYKFENLINGHKYIGQAKDITRRYKNHLTRANNDFASNTEYNSPLHRAIRKYGIENFSFSIVEECTEENLNEREIYWIEHYKSYDKTKGYNITSGGNNNGYNIKFDSSFIKKIQDLLMNTLMSYEEIHQEYGVSLGKISEINTGKSNFDSTLTYPLRTKQFDKKVWLCNECGAIVSKGSVRCVECAKKAQRVVARPSREELKQMIRTIPFTQIAKKYSIADKTVCKWCDAYNLPRTKKEIKTYSDAEWEKI